LLTPPYDDKVEGRWHPRHQCQNLPETPFSLLDRLARNLRDISSQQEEDCQGHPHEDERDDTNAENEQSIDEDAAAVLVAVLPSGGLAQHTPVTEHVPVVGEPGDDAKAQVGGGGENAVPRVQGCVCAVELKAVLLEGALGEAGTGHVAGAHGEGDAAEDEEGDSARERARAGGDVEWPEGNERRGDEDGAEC